MLTHLPYQHLQNPLAPVTGCVNDREAVLKSFILEPLFKSFEY